VAVNCRGCGGVTHPSFWQWCWPCVRDGQRGIDDDEAQLEILERAAWLGLQDARNPVIDIEITHEAML
jgi:hypothetical protein